MTPDPEDPQDSDFLNRIWDNASVLRDKAREALENPEESPFGRLMALRDFREAVEQAIWFDEMEFRFNQRRSRKNGTTPTGNHQSMEKTEQPKGETK